MNAVGAEVTGNQLRWAIADALVLTKRGLLRYRRVPQLLVFSTIQPVMFVLLFRYVFGGSIEVPGIAYVDYLMPGIFVQTSAFGATNTAIGLTEDLSKGLVDRFRSLPMARSAVLAGRCASDTVRNLFVVVLMTIVGMLVGFRFHAGLVPALATIALAVGFGLAMSFVSALIGLSLRDPEATQSAGFLWIFPLTFASSAFVSPDNMPDWLQAFAEVNPVSITADAMRALVLGGPTATKVLQALAWIGGLVVVFAPLAVRKYRRVA